MSNINVNNIIDFFSTNQITLNSTGRPSITNLNPNIIYRNGDDSSLSLLTLSSFNDIHVYTSNTYNATLYMRTGLVTNSLYEMWTVCDAGTTNIDPGLYPNGVAYTDEFTQSYRSTQQSDGTFVSRIETGPRFWFDHQNGALGTAPMSHYIFSTGPTNKYVQFEGADTGPSLSTGYGRWTNNSRTWDYVGYIDYLALLAFKRSWIRRIG